MEKFKEIEGLRFTRVHVVRSLKSARAHKKKYEDAGFQCRIFKEGPAKYVVYARRKSNVRKS